MNWVSISLSATISEIAKLQSNTSYQRQHVRRGHVQTIAHTVERLNCTDIVVVWSARDCVWLTEWIWKENLHTLEFWKPEKKTEEKIIFKVKVDWEKRMKCVFVYTPLSAAVWEACKEREEKKNENVIKKIQKQLRVERHSWCRSGRESRDRYETAWERRREARKSFHTKKKKMPRFRVLRRASVRDWVVTVHWHGFSVFPFPLFFRSSREMKFETKFFFSTFWNWTKYLSVAAQLRQFFTVREQFLVKLEQTSFLISWAFLLAALFLHYVIFSLHFSRDFPRQFYVAHFNSMHKFLHRAVSQSQHYTAVMHLPI